MQQILYFDSQNPLNQTLVGTHKLQVYMKRFADYQISQYSYIEVVYIINK